MKKLKKLIMSIDFENVQIGTWVRLMMILLSIVFYVMRVLGLTPPAVEENTVWNVLIALFGVISMIQAYWKNNSITNAAIKADEFMNQLKDEKENENGIR